MAFSKSIVVVILAIIAVSMVKAQVFGGKDKPSSYNSVQGYNPAFGGYNAYNPYNPGCQCGPGAAHGASSAYGSYNPYNPYSPAGYGGFPQSNRYTGAPGGSSYGGQAQPPQFG